ncbi:hypothetical protein VNO78_33191 [Psophocarpus tetragonolobus]|uniref:MADS-box domain-containing protein n=1 Tax=Psophocarpus tetragonolobus TaxID=3891 RepID=A0AAN9RPI6_PSOTE
MAPTKVKLAFIDNDAKRKTTYKKRKNSLLKKTEELSTLCGLQACAIVYGPNDDEPEIWPSASGVQNVLAKFRSEPKSEQSKRMENQESLIAQSIVKGRKKIQELVQENKHNEMCLFLFQCLKLGNFELHDNKATSVDFNILSSLIEKNLYNISKRLEWVKVQPLMQAATHEVALHEDGNGLNMNANTKQSQQFINFLNVC